MTADTNQAVADGIIGRLTRKFCDLVERIRKNIIDHKRVYFFMQRAAENPPKDIPFYDYVLQIHWSWDHHHHEFITIVGEEYETPFEDMVKTDEGRSEIKRMVGRIVKQYGTFSAADPIRIYRVHTKNYFNLDLSMGLTGKVSGEFVDVHLQMKPIIEFDKEGNPMPY